MNWEDRIKELFPRVGEIYLVEDPDKIMDDKEVLSILRKENINFIDYKDPIKFRYLYETNYRLGRTNTVVIRTENLKEIPYDIYSNSFHIQIALKEILHNLDSSAAKKYSYGVKALIETDLNQKNTISYDDTKKLLSSSLERIFEEIPNESLPDAKDYATFGIAAMKIGQWRAYSSVLSKNQISNINSVNSNFQDWLINNYDQTVSLPYLPKPKMVHQIPDFMNQSEYKQKKALIVMDGMSFSQWYMIEEYLINNHFRTEVNPVLSWIPSITPVSRQSIFSGTPPINFGKSITTTQNEGKKWKEFWVSKGYKKTDIFYKKALGKNNYEEMDIRVIIREKKILGCVVDSIDNFLHGAQQGIWSVQSELKYWLNQGFLLSFLNDLILNKFDVFITSDHGNIESQGIGRINQGILVNSKGERVRIYDDENIRNNTRDKYFKVSQAWNSSFLPKDYFPLIAKENFAFVNNNDKIVGHGGTNIEEVFVPFVKVTR